MTAMSIEHVILFAGPMGAGKTTAIASLSDIPVVSTEATNNDLDKHPKEFTTVAMDYGEISLADGEVVRLYGVPGQDRFDFMWRILESRAEGMILLLDNAAEDPVADLDFFLDSFRALCRRKTVIVGITRTDVDGSPGLEPYHQRLQQRRQDIPVFEVDARNREQVLVMLTTLAVMVEIHSAEAGVH
jgi:signal recognition particle receptor subunit beta